MIFDFAESEFRSIELYVRRDCPVCQTKQKPATVEKRLAWLCGSNTVNVNPEKPTALDLNGVIQVLQHKHRILLATPMVLVFDYNGHEVSIFKRGRMLIKNVETETEALQLYLQIEKIIRT
jgi:adenylyltransferase/sulfurtransferase